MDIRNQFKRVPDLQQHKLNKLEINSKQSITDFQNTKDIEKY